MGLLEIIEIRSIQHQHMNIFDHIDIKNLVNKKGFSCKPHTIKLFTHKTLATDVSIHMYYKDDDRNPLSDTAEGNSPGMYIASLCREWGLVNVSLWQEERTYHV